MFGMRAINTGVVSNASVPFGGIKQSGFGREGGHEAMHEYFDTVSVFEGELP
jgi:succinate-semialdehyde dehydrogenase/glutarate-semialdehyde dehydrogenase